MPFIKSKRKVHSLGDSLAMTLPSIYTKMNNIKKGETLEIYYHIEDILLVTNKDQEKVINSITKFLSELKKDSKY